MSRFDSALFALHLDLGTSSGSSSASTPVAMGSVSTLSDQDLYNAIVAEVPNAPATL